MGSWQMALQKLGCSCHVQKPTPAATITTATTPTTMGHFRFRRGRCARASGCASRPPGAFARAVAAGGCGSDAALGVAACEDRCLRARRRAFLGRLRLPFRLFVHVLSSPSHVRAGKRQGFAAPPAGRFFARCFPIP